MKSAGGLDLLLYFGKLTTDWLNDLTTFEEVNKYMY